MAHVSPTSLSANFTNGDARATSGFTDPSSESKDFGAIEAMRLMPVLNTPGDVPKRADTVGIPITFAALPTSGSEYRNTYATAAPPEHTVSAPSHVRPGAEM
jgi:hypothetical protein